MQNAQKRLELAESERERFGLFLAWLLCQNLRLVELDLTVRVGGDLGIFRNQGVFAGHKEKRMVRPAKR